MSSKKPYENENQGLLFELPPAQALEPQIKRIHNPVWTENKAKLIERYLNLFVFITKHGTYIDGFAGPQEPDKPEMWAAKLVMESDPKWLQHFYLFEKDKAKVKQLQQLKESVSAGWKDKIKREIEIYPGDSNIEIHKLLESERIKQTEATFCLLDQRTFQCEWRTVEALAKYKTQGNKIELFYFLANSWMGRTFAAQKRDLKMIEKWWGDEDWQTLREMKSRKRAEAFVNRFKEKLGYRYVQPWPIYEKPSGGGNIMYYMIHATDHEEAPKLMRRAYGRAVWSTPPAEQTSFQF